MSETATPRTASIKSMVANFNMGESIPYKHAIELCASLEVELATATATKEKWRTLAIERKRYLRRANKAAERNSTVAQLAVARNVMNWKALCEARRGILTTTAERDRLRHYVEQFTTCSHAPDYDCPRCAALFQFQLP